MNAAPCNLVADVGGTHTRVALADGARVRPESVRRYTNRTFVERGEGLDAVLAAYVAGEPPFVCTAAAAAIAGPVADGAGELTNLAWRIDRATLARVTGAVRAEVLNDLQAQGHALGDLAPGALRPVLPGRAAEAHATRLVIGAGTGFNVAPVFHTPAGRLVPPSESGHTGLPLRTEADLRLADYLAHKIATPNGFADVEEALSGRGVEHLYHWHGLEAGNPHKRRAADIMAALGASDDPVARATAQTYIRLLGNVASNLALTFLPYGGIYFIGGVVRAMQPWFDEFGFARAFTDKGRFRDFMGQFPVWIIEDDFAALTGCASFLSDRLAA